ncbi:AEC family transporter [Sporolactobacillus shoreae]|uniref:AEC family transporter n=1 Tax=Sporolactobacillus shoreae TaxID=1465501 RepID=A0A4Z0GP00_9BACL|nr:AEC family transporter [Sporolactobacillus shoreae]TGA97634.1 AEC family transporter [Sporolactobacillus shoreae]
MSAYLKLLMSITIPIVIICACGFALQKRRPVDTKLLADISLYIMAPALILYALSGAHLQGENILHIFLFSIVMTVLLWVLAIVVAKLAHLSENEKRGLTLTTLFSNANNYGLPVLLLAFGSAGFALGAVYVVGQVILVNVLGMYIASRSQLNGKQAMIHILKAPLIYACVAGILLDLFHFRLFGGMETAVQMLGTAYPVLVLMILGIKLSTTKLKGLKSPKVWLGVILRLAIVPLLTKLVLFVLGIHGLLASVLFVEASMPAAINTVTLAEKFGGDTETISLVVSITTILSFVYLPFFIAIS